MPLSESKKRPFEQVKVLGVVAKRVDPIVRDQAFGLHTGLLYKIDGEGPRIAHLGWHEVQIDNEPDENYLWADVNLDETNCIVIASWLDDRRLRPDKIPYGFRIDGSPYDPVTGEFIPPPLGRGLTCATFIVAVLEHLGFQLLEQHTWPSTRADDVAWQEGILAALAKTGVSQAHVDALSNDVGSTRFRPEEVCGATVLAPDWPVAFADARVVAEEVLAVVDAFRPDA